ncbi:coiled-coil domain-containing protein 146 [Takifugu flavidus]|nr:coiled-coil domain-containing protein 146 [Takifugu flavidus]XP_056879027.1 coiled-coil domain-containing protein 146 [Takifugu flavidus]
MSLCEEQNDNGRGEEEEEEEETLAPDASPPQEQPAANTDVSASPLQHLEELLWLGRISRTNVAKLKAFYELLQDTLQRTRDSETRLLEEAKGCRAELERLRAGEAGAEEQGGPEDPESEVTHLRRQLLGTYDELKAAEDRDYETQHKLKCLQEEKLSLEKESQLQLKPSELESRAKALRDKHEDLRREVAQRQLEVRSLMEDLESSEEQMSKGWKELEDKREIVLLKEAEKAQLICVPDQILKEAQRKHFKKEVALKKSEALSAEIAEMEKRAKDAGLRNSSLRSKTEELNEESEALRAQVEVGHAKHRELLRELDLRKEEKVELLGNRGLLEMKLQSIMSDRKQLHKTHSVQLREKNRQMQTLMRMERMLATATERLERTRSIYNELQAQLDAVPKRDSSIQQRMELQREVDALKVSLEKQLLVAEEESQKQQHYGMVQELLRHSNNLSEELQNLRCLTKIKAEERGQKHRELLRAQRLNQHVQQELLEKDLIIADHNKLNATLQSRLSQYCKLSHMVTEEKNKYVRLKQMTVQTVSELKEQLKVQENEAEIQRSLVVSKDRSLTKAHVKINNSSKTRDKLRNDISKMALKCRQISQDFEDNELELARLGQMIKLHQDALTDTNGDLETARQRRNFLGLQLLEQEEVLLSYTNELSARDAAIAERNMELETAEKEARDLRLAIREEKRQIDLRKKEVLQEKWLEGEIATLQIELAEALDKTFASLNQPADYKELKGKDPSSVELLHKIEQLEGNLAERERQVLERQLLLDQVTRLSEPLGERVESCQQHRLSLAKKLNEVRTNIMDTNHRLMVLAAEFSIKQATTLSLQQEIKEKEHQVDRCREQQEQGLPPCPEIEEEWRRMLRDKRRRQRDKEERERMVEEDEWNQLPDGDYTTAEPRPNAYIPQTDLLPLPRPYGAQAPFRPSQAGANIRHIRKPALKSVEM